jgi:hypothetical protein
MTLLLTSNRFTSETVSAVTTVPFSDDKTGTLCLQDTNQFLLCRLAETYDAPSRSVYAHADNGSMACTASDETPLLYEYRTLTALSFNNEIRLFDAGGHGHQPIGVGYLCIPAYRLPPFDAVPDKPTVPCSIFVRMYHTTTIPGVIVSHCAISKQLKTHGYGTAHVEDCPGFIRFPRLSISSSAHASDVSLHIQPMWCCGGLTFTEALLIPTTDKHLVPRLLSMNALDRFIMCSILATPGAVCQTYPMDLDSPMSLLRPCHFHPPCTTRSLVNRCRLLLVVLWSGLSIALPSAFFGINALSM